MSNKTSQEKIKAFVERWTGKGYEKGESQMFWIELLTDVLGVETPSEIISFEDQVKLDHTSFIDAYIKTTHVMIEQKSIDKNLRAPIKQSDGKSLTSFAQAKRYAAELPYSMRPRWIVTCNFKSFLIYDMEQPQGEPFEILLENLPKEAHKLLFLVEDKDVNLRHEMEVSMKAGEIVGKLYDAFLAQYEGETTQEDLHALNVLCVRLVFCLYAEDADIFAKDQFADYLQSYKPENLRVALKELFEVLDTPIEKRSRFLSENLKAFPYVNGSLFSQQPGEDIPQITQETADLLIRHASQDFDWSDISPTIFGAVFESTLNPETRRKGGMHYTSIENIHKVIDPLFMDDLNEEFDDIRVRPKGKPRTQRLYALQDKLASLVILDPACGSGNFLTETYISLRRLENRILQELFGMEKGVGFKEISPIKVHIHQFYGIEINDFAVSVAKTALWIAESQMLNETERIIQFDNNYLPLKSYNNITEGNALRINWEEIVPKDRLSYIIGNPPFVGKSFQTKEQKDDMAFVMSDVKNYGNLDYVTCWHKKVADFIKDTSCEAALVSTNSICQGIAVPPLWNYLFAKGIHINFAWPTFKWDSESSLKAAVHCVIIGFSYIERKKKFILSEEKRYTHVDNINAYLLDADNIIIEDIHEPICDVPQTAVGSFPTDGGHLVLQENEMEDFIKKEPSVTPYVKMFLGPWEFINNHKRYCLWLKNCPPSLLCKMPHVLKRLKEVKEFRLASSKKQTQNRAETPHLFAEDRQPDSNYILFPRTSSANRQYIPIGFLGKDTIAGDTIIIPNATVYHFGVLTSCVHQTWIKLLCGRMKSDYRYSGTLVYNTFPWPTPTPEQRANIEQTAQAILDARNKYPESSLADMYGDTMFLFPELLKAHRENDKAVMQAYGFPKDFSESDIVAELFKMYKAMTEGKK